MASPPNTTNITPPRVPVMDPRTGLISREWYRFLLNLYTITGAGTGVTPTANGGTNSTATPTAGGIAYGDGASYKFTLAGAPGLVLTSTGTGAPEWTSTSSGTVSSVDVSGGSTGLITYGGPITSSGVITLTGTLNTSSGGTNSTATPTAGAVPYGTGTAYDFTAVGTAGQVLTSAGAGTPTWATPTTGTVTSVGQTFTGGLISVAGSPITSSGTLALTVAGTSGGVPYFSSASTWASSAALAANALVIGGGAGVAPATTTTGTGVVTALGTNVGTAGAFVVNGGALGTPSSGTVTNLTGTASINIDGTVGATTPTTGVFTTVVANTSAGVGAIAPTATNFYNAKDITGATTAVANSTIATIQSDVTVAARGYLTTLGTAASTTLTNLQHYAAIQGTFSGTSVTNQFGFNSNATLIGAGTNYAFNAGNTAATTGTAYGFFSAINTPTAGGTTWGFYASGTANNYFGGNVAIGRATPTVSLDVNGAMALRAPSTVNAATYTVTVTDSSLRFTTTACTVTLPAAASFTGRILYLNNVTAIAVTSASSNVIPLGSNTAGTAILAATAGKFAMIQSNGTNWITMMAN